MKYMVVIGQHIASLSASSGLQHHGCHARRAQLPLPRGGAAGRRPQEAQENTAGAAAIRRLERHHDRRFAAPACQADVGVLLSIRWKSFEPGTTDAEHVLAARGRLT